jgi:hypothetical protein
VSLRARVEEYLALRRALGYKLQTEGRMLLDFADSLDATGQSTVTVQAALAWATESRQASAQHRGVGSPATWADRDYPYPGWCLISAQSAAGEGVRRALVRHPGLMSISLMSFLMDFVAEKDTSRNSAEQAEPLALALAEKDERFEALTLGRVHRVQARGRPPSQDVRRARTGDSLPKCVARPG